jgi:protoporphyrinogen oxidase
MQYKADILILGGGVSGLALAERLKDSGLNSLVIEKAGAPGGLSRTAKAGEFFFDLGGHRLYFSKPETREWTEKLLAGRGLLRRKRSSAVFTGGRLLKYPPTPLNGLLYAAPLLFAKRRPAAKTQNQPTLKDWLESRLGRGVHDRYFRDYTKKVWGLGTDELSPLWAERRIGGGFSIKSILVELLGGGLSSKENAGCFLYPEKGIGELPRALMEKAGKSMTLLTGAEPLELDFRDGRPAGLTFEMGGERHTARFRLIVSTIPLRSLLNLFPSAAKRAGGIKYRSMVVLFAALRRRERLAQHWIYFPDKDAAFSRACELANWSRSLAPGGWLPMTFEFFCDEGDAVWNMGKDELAALAFASPALKKLAGAYEAGPTSVERLPHAYPLLYSGSETPLDAAKAALAGFPNLLLCGRTGSHAYLDTEECLLDAWAAAAAVKKILHENPVRP